jgi:glutathione synthase/RimK-type ligase-like ATP-grasp enzyme
MKMDTQAQLDETLHMCDPRKPVIVQEFIEASHGKDLRVYVIGGKARVSLCCEGVPCAAR